MYSHFFAEFNQKARDNFKNSLTSFVELNKLWTEATGDFTKQTIQTTNGLLKQHVAHFTRCKDVKHANDLITLHSDFVNELNQKFIDSAQQTLNFATVTNQQYQSWFSSTCSGFTPRKQEVEVKPATPANTKTKTKTKQASKSATA